jgi:hypothetical protein
VVVDARGKVLGAPFGVSAVRVRVGDRVASLFVGRDQIISGFAQVVFEDPDCSGQPFLSAPAGTLLDAVGVSPSNLLLGIGGPSETRIVRSRLAFGAPPTCVTNPDTPLVVFPSEVLLDLRLFTPPFRFRP